MKNIILFIALLVPGFLMGEILIIHEKLVEDQWVMDITVLADTDDVKLAIDGIDADPAKRRGPNFQGFGGIRLQILEEIINGENSWKNEPVNEYVIFWMQLGPDGSLSGDPADFFTETFTSLEAAETFVQQVMDDPLRDVWDNRPFHATKEYTEHQEPSVTIYKIVAE